MKLYRLTSLPNNAPHIPHDGKTFYVGKLYAIEPERFDSVVVGNRSHYTSRSYVYDPKSVFEDIRSRWEFVGETPTLVPPANMAEVGKFCDEWRNFLLDHQSADDLGEPREMSEQVMQTLNNGLRAMRDRPQLPAALQMLPHVDAIEGLLICRDWASATNVRTREQSADNELSGGTEVPCVSSKGKSWQEVAERLERLRSSGEAFTSYAKLAALIGCSSQTIYKAIHQSPLLEAWAEREPAKPRAQSINEVVTDSTAQNRELSPEDQFRIREHLDREDLTDQDRASFNALPSEAAQIEYLDRLEELAAKQKRDDRNQRIFDRNA